ncbi:MAG: Rrf2 family transcriptional regulator [Candidatus Krumholzibacteria bacterium]|nr:Rrf2 family transcriptional regulator [Candidatus Krumholzibacteria bacterium]
MRFTAMFRYGLRALAVLADNFDQRPVSAKEISESEDISAPFLEQLLANLRRHGLISGVRGPGGGFRLAKPPGEIAVSEIVEALEGPVYVSSCLHGNCAEQTETACERLDDCTVVPILKRIEAEINGVLSSYRLSDVRALFEREKHSPREGGSSGG